MKKICLSALALCLISGLNAQNTPAFGLKGGLNISQLHPDEENPAATIGTTLGFHVGVIAHTHISKSLGFQPELLYSGEGMEQTTNGNTFDWKLNYLRLPLMIQYMFNNGFRIEAGLVPGLLLNAKIQNNTGFTSATSSFSKGDLAVGLGLNYLTYSGFGIGGRYNLGLSNVNANKGSAYYKYNTRTGQISIFYMFNNNHKAASAK
jgi:Outer membrane protein beta-barrel domain